MRGAPLALALAFLALSGALHLFVGVPADLPLADLFASGGGFAETLFWQGAMPRASMAVLVGAGLGLAGSAIQEITRNPLASPVTLGTVSGAWTALLLATIFAPALAAAYGIWICLIGGAGVTALVLAVAGFARMDGLILVILGIAANLFLGGVGVVLALLHGQVANSLFIWGAGDLTQTGWIETIWLAPQIAVAAIALLSLSRPLTLMRLGHQVAGGRGLGTVPLSIGVMGLAVWLTAASVSAVGAIGFIGLIAPNLVRLLGVQTTFMRLLLGAIAGAAALLLTDCIPVALADWSKTLIPSGSSAALIGAPALILLAFRHMRAERPGSFHLPGGRNSIPLPLLGLILATCPVAALLAIGFGGSPDGPVWIGTAAPALRDMLLSLRWPSVLAAAAAGTAMATAGTILQRLLRNPLASPDVLGVTSGATFAIVVAVLLAGLPPAETAAPSAAIGSLAVLGLLTLLWRRRDTPPSLLILTGIALAALLDALVHFALAKGGEEANTLLTWLTGATFLTGPTEALMLSGCTFLVLGAALASSRWLTLLSLGEATAAARGLHVERVRQGMLLLVSVATASVIAWVGPISFVGLLAPHAAAMLGARTAGQQLVASAGIGCSLLVMAELIGRIAFYPNQIAAGAIATLIGGAYLFGVLLLGMVRRRTAVL